ncbi:MAG: hypothetical protein FWH41_04990 [Treponema sp.]|nr:hypothetical protein [Treponema sp.]
MQEIAISLVNATRGNATYNGGEYFFKYNIENGINYYISLDQPENPLKIKLFIQNKTTGKKELISAYPELVYRNIINFNEFDVNE